MEKIFSLKRRKFILGLSALVFCSSAFAAGVNASKNIAKKVKNVILPAGAHDANRMVNSCLNCNLCVRNCPNGILEKENKEFTAVHINYEQGKGYCEFNCNKCSQICPAGALKKLSLEEKQHTRIGIASISSDCVGCSACVRVCPVGAISINKEHKAVLDGSKCIGCGKCKKACPVDAIKIYGVNKQAKV